MYKHALIIYFFVNLVRSQNAPLVTTTQGVISGLVGEDGGYMYLGIPYGVVDRLNPFGHSIPHPGFEGTFAAVDDSAICPQREEFNNTLAGSLDCLHLSVFVPNSQDNTPKSVLVWTYGGRFEIGFYGRFLFGPKYLTRHNIILVTINYRLGPYGFMCTDSPLVPGNQGLKDQLMAFRWINENIANFGGDPNMITIAGNSAGSMSVDFHILRNHEPRLFQQAILQSGTSLCPSFPRPDIRTPFTLSRHFGLDTDDIRTAIDFLATIDELDMIEACEELGLSFRPCLEESFDGVEEFLNHNWVANETLPLAKDLNIIVGYNQDEGFAFVSGTQNFDNSVNDALTATFDIDHEEFDGQELTRLFYYGDEEITREGEGFQNAVDMGSDFAFIHPSIRSVARFVKNEAKKVYLYVFTYVGGRNFVKHKNNITEGGALHADEQGYLFDISYMDEPTGQDLVVLDRMTTMWANFVKYGDPTPEVTNLLPVKWEPVTATSYNYVEIGAGLTAGTRPYNERMTFLDLMFEKYGHLRRFILEHGEVQGRL